MTRLSFLRDLLRGAALVFSAGVVLGPYYALAATKGDTLLPILGLVLAVFLTVPAASFFYWVVDRTERMR